MEIKGPLDFEFNISWRRKNKELELIRTNCFKTLLMHICDDRQDNTKVLIGTNMLKQVINTV